VNSFDPEVAMSLDETLDREEGFASVVGRGWSEGKEPIRFRVELNLPSEVTLTLRNLAGTVVYEALLSAPPGGIEIEWNVCDQKGHPVPQGNYIYVLRASDGTEWLSRTGKVTVVN